MFWLSINGKTCDVYIRSILVSRSIDSTRFVVAIMGNQNSLAVIYKWSTPKKIDAILLDFCASTGDFSVVYRPIYCNKFTADVNYTVYVWYRFRVLFRNLPTYARNKYSNFQHIDYCNCKLEIISGNKLFSFFWVSLFVFVFTDVVHWHFNYFSFSTAYLWWLTACIWFQNVKPYGKCWQYRSSIYKTRMWANAQPDGRPAEHIGIETRRKAVAGWGYWEGAASPSPTS